MRRRRSRGQTTSGRPQGPLQSPLCSRFSIQSKTGFFSIQTRLSPRPPESLFRDSLGQTQRRPFTLLCASSWLGRASPRQKRYQAVWACRAHLAAEETKAKDKSRRLSPESSRFSTSTATRETAYKVPAYKTTADLCRRWSARATERVANGTGRAPGRGGASAPEGAADVLPRRRLRRRPRRRGPRPRSTRASTATRTTRTTARWRGCGASAARRTSNRGGRRPSAATRCSRSSSRRSA